MDGRPGLTGRNGHARQLSTVPTVQKDQLSGPIDHGDGHVPAIAGCLLLGGHEVYSGAGQIPTQYNRTQANGKPPGCVVLLWTR